MAGVTSLPWTPATYVGLVVALSWPGIGLGALYGAVGWRAHRTWGGVAGAIAGCCVCLGGFIAWDASDLSYNVSFPRAALLPLTKGFQGLLLGTAAGGWYWRSRRLFGAGCGALVGTALWFAGWFYLSGHH